MEKRELVFRVRLSEVEAKKIFASQKKTYLSKSEYCRRVLLDKADTIFSKEDIAVRTDIRNQMRWISINVNQIAKSLNGILKNDKPLVLSQAQLQMIDKLREVLTLWAETKRRIL